MNLLYLVYLTILLLGLLAGVIRYKYLDIASRLLLTWLAATLVTEILAYWMAKQYGNNLLLYGIANIIQAALLCLYFNYAVLTYKKYRVGYVFAVLSIIVGIDNLLYFQWMDQLATYFLIYTGLLVTVATLHAFFVFLKEPNALMLGGHPHFWFMLILVIFWVTTMLSWLLYNYIKDKVPEYAPHLNLFIILINIFTYLVIGTIFLLYPKIIRYRV